MLNELGIRRRIVGMLFKFASHKKQQKGDKIRYSSHKILGYNQGEKTTIRSTSNRFQMIPGELCKPERSIETDTVGREESRRFSRDSSSWDGEGFRVWLDVWEDKDLSDRVEEVNGRGRVWRRPLERRRETRESDLRSIEWESVLVRPREVESLERAPGNKIIEACS